MLNQTILVGRLTRDPELVTLADGRNVTTITLAVKRSYKNNETGEYETDFIDCDLWHGIALAANDYCKKGNTIGVKARISVVKKDVNGIKINSLKLIAEKITFINNK